MKEELRKNKSEVKKKFSVLIFGEGRTEKRFSQKMRENEKFLHHISKITKLEPVFRIGCHHGNSPSTILERAVVMADDGDYDSAIALIDVDQLKNNFPKNWEVKKQELDKKAHDHYISIVWQVENFEDEITRVFQAQEKISHAQAKKLYESDMDLVMRSKSPYAKKIYHSIKASHENKLALKE